MNFSAPNSDELFQFIIANRTVAQPTTKSGWLPMIAVMATIGTPGPAPNQAVPKAPGVGRLQMLPFCAVY
jgi:hypothetical protein